jgi:hypothetical protein
MRKLTPVNPAKGNALFQLLALTKPITEGKKIAIAKIAQLEGFTLAIVNMPKGTAVAIRLTTGICRRFLGNSHARIAISKTPEMEFTSLILMIEADRFSLANQLIVQ